MERIFHEVSLTIIFNDSFLHRVRILFCGENVIEVEFVSVLGVAIDFHVGDSSGDFSPFLLIHSQTSSGS